MNQIGVSLKEILKNINWDFLYNQKKLTVHGIPVAMNAIGYGLMIKSYIRSVHNRPLGAGLTPKQSRANKSIEKPSIRALLSNRSTNNYVSFT